MLDGFTEFDVAVSATTIHGRRGGSGPPLLLLHGFPETHLMWHRVAPALAREHTVVLADLRGNGGSGAPPSSPDHAPYSMQALANDQVELMQAFGFERFGVAGHDRGARCAYRMALDHPAVVDRLALLDVVPTGDAFDSAGMDFALGFWVWSFLAAPYPVPERLIEGAPAVLVDYALDHWGEDPAAFPPDVRAAYAEHLSRPATIHAICEQYRAAATLDYAADSRDRGTRRIECAVLVLWSAGGAVAAWYDVLDVWRQWARDVQGRSIAAGHFLPEEAPGEVGAALRAFFAG